MHGIIFIIQENGYGAFHYIAFHIVFGKVWIQLFSLQLWFNSWPDWALSPWPSNQSRRKKTEFMCVKLHWRTDLGSHPAHADYLVNIYIHSRVCVCVYIYIYIYIYTHSSLDKNIRPPSKMKKNIFYNFKIMKIRFMKDKTKIIEFK